MSNIFESVLSFNLGLSLLLASILALRWLLKKVAKVYNVYWLWVLLPLVPLLGAIATSIPEEKQVVIVEQFNTVQVILSPTISNLAPAAFNYEFESLELVNSSSIELLPIFAYPWLIGCLLLVFRLLQQHRSLRAQLISSKVSINTEFKNQYPIVDIDIDGFSPAVYGFFKPKIYFPKALYNQLNPDQRTLILEHEEQHIRQGHLWLNLVWDLTVCLNWFNPLLYVARYLYRHDQEVLCDSLVLKNHDEPRQQAYGHALLSTVSATQSVSLLCSWKMFDQLEERIMNIKSKHKKAKLVVLASAIVSVLSITSLYAIASAKEAISEKETMKGFIKIIDIAPPNKEVDERLRANKVISSIGILSIDYDGEKKIVIKSNGKTFRMENGEQFAMEGNLRRDLREDELAEMQDLLERSERTRSPNNLDEIFNTDNVSIRIKAYKDLDTLKTKFESVTGIYDQYGEYQMRRLKTELAFNQGLQGGLTEKYINTTLEQARRSDSPDDPNVQMAIESLEQTKLELMESKMLIKKQREQALDQIVDLQKIYQGS